jgi:hypothetical protein
VPWKIKDFSLQPIFREVSSFIEIKIRSKPLRFAKPEKDRHQFSGDHIIGILSVPKHVSVLDHAQILGMHGCFGTKFLTEIGGIAGMVLITMG